MDVKNRQVSNFSEKEMLIAEVGRLLSHPARIRVMNLLLENKSMTSSEIASRIPLARTTVLQHIAALKDGDWLKTTSDGSSIQYSINSFIFNTLSADMAMFFQNCSKSENRETKKTRILFMCTGNSCRSQMAEGFINATGDKYNVEAVSAGTRPAEGIQPMAIEAMAEKNIDISSQYPKNAKDFIGDRLIDLVIIVCDQAEKECPYLFPFSKRKIFMPFKDPKTAEEFREVRDQIEKRIQYLLEELTAGQET